MGENQKEFQSGAGTLQVRKIGLSLIERMITELEGLE